MRILLFLALFLFASQDVHACRYQARPFEESLKSAAVSFIGTVTTVENRLAVIKVEKAIKGVKDGETLDVEIGESSCAIRFAAGQRWIYLGDSAPSGSLLLMDENGDTVGDNLKLVQTLVPGIADDSPEVVGGTLEPSCAPWDGAAFAIRLDNGVGATVFDHIKPLEDTGRNAPAVFQADERSERGHGRIVQCPRLKDGKPSDQPCQSVKGMIFMGGVDAEYARGRLLIEEGEHHSQHVFKVKRVHKQVFCG